MRYLALAALLLVGCDGDPDPRTLSLEVMGPSMAATGEEITITAQLDMFAPESLADMSRLAVYVPEGTALDGVVSGPEVGEPMGLGAPTIIGGLENGEGDLETLLDFLADDIAFGDQSLTVSFTYRCVNPGTAPIYVDATFRGDEPMDRVNRVETASVMCSGDPLDGGRPATDAGPGDTDAGPGDTDAGPMDAGTDDAGAADAGGSSDAGPGDAG